MAKRGRKPKFSKEMFNRVLDRVSELEPTYKAIQAEGMTPSGFYKALKRVDPTEELKGTLEEAQLFRDKLLNQALLEEAHGELYRRAFGWEEPVFYKGEIVGTRPRYSDVCLIMLLKSLAPEKYRDPTRVRNIASLGKGAPENESQGHKDWEKELAKLVYEEQQRLARNQPPPDNQ